MLKSASFSCSFLILLSLISCSSSEKTITPLPYDPPGVTITTDKEIFPQYYRTISFSRSGVFVSNEFEGARLNDFYQVDESTYTAVILPENTPINDSPWYAFKLWSINEKNIKLNFTYKDGTHRYKPKISYDGKNWRLYDTTKVFVDTTNNIATLELNLSEDTLWISAQELITSSFYKKWIDEISKKDFVRNDIIGKSADGKDIFKVEIGKSDNKNFMVLIGRNHPPEVTGFFALKNFVETIAEESETAKEFRNNVTTIVIPLVNPDGVDYGHWRHNARGVDLNRDWVEFNQPEPRTVKNEVEKILSEQDNKIIFFIDFHSTTEDIFYTFSLESLMNDNLSEERTNKRMSEYNFINQWLQNLQKKLPDYHVNIVDSLSKSSSPTSDRWFMREYDVPGLTYETGDETDREIIKKVAVKAAEELMNRSPFLTLPLGEN
jgi:murein tripeptide amidase MpaA